MTRHSAFTSSAATAAIAAYWVAPLRAHVGEPLAPHDVWTAWSLDLFVAVPLAASAALFARGLGRFGADGLRQTARAGAFAAGWLAAVVALVSPLDAMGGVLFSAHMLQHEVLMLVAAPLLVVSRPLGPMMLGLPAGSRRRLARAGRHARLYSVGRTLERPAVAWSLHAVLLWVWHLPSLFDATLQSDAIHAAQHISFFGSALLFWSSVLPMHGSNVDHGIAIFSVFTTMLHSGLLGALLTFAPATAYSAYEGTTLAWGLTQLEDQQIGGLLMWIPAGIVYVGVGLMLVGRLLRRAAPPIPEPL